MNTVEQNNGAGQQEQIVLSEMREHVGIITMNHNKKLNALSSELVQEVLDALSRLEAAEARVIILRAAPGARVWSAGHNIKEVPLDGQDPVTWNVPFEKLLHRVHGCPLPVIGMIEGSVWGGACDLAMTCDLLVGTPTTTFAITPAKLGLSYNTAGVNHFLGVVPVHIVKQMLFTAQPLPAEDAYRLGILNSLVAAEDLEAAALQFANQIASRAPLAVKVLKKEVQSLTAGAGIQADAFEEIQDMRREVYRSEDFQEGIRAFFERRDPLFKGK
ncbi:methylmalonyl-CoA decarboxylase [Desulfogranum mediterraneum]|uniref:methylmalonyl-CoA decarboxylase n=1 Tax=Desulfogranum mediterraneum TaxID=160661 RepID=UPI0006862FCA|nr:methylmalonyl-CoA decarboxylase [Desulfogranum mediterraneum]